MLRGDNRAQSIQVGAILLFGILIIALATAQATIIPDQNASVEFDHSQTIQSDMQELRNGIVRAADGSAEPVRLMLGTTYPNRILFVSPPPPTGTLQTVGPDDRPMNVTLTNADGSVSVGSDHENARDYWANAPRAGVYNTTEVVYQPDYAAYDGAPTTVYGATVLYNTFDNGANRTITGQRLVQGNTIDLTVLRGDVSATSAGAHTADLSTVSEQARTVTVRSETGNRLYINVTSRLSASVWNQTLLGTNANATAVDTWTDGDVTYHRIAIKLDPGTYRLRAGAAAIGAISDAERENATEPAYMIVAEDYEPVANGTNGSLTVEVRDRFNNPVTGATVNASADGEYLRLINQDGEIVNATTFETDSEGQAEIRYHANATTASGASINASIGAESYEQANFTGLSVPEFTVGGDGGELNPGTTGDLIQTGATIPQNEKNVANVVFNNTLETQVNITSARISFYYYSGGNNKNPTSAIVEDGANTPYTLEVGGKYETFGTPIPITSDTDKTIRFEFDEDIGNQDFFVLRLVFEYDGQSYRETYFVAPR
jgi:hypothetical protein